MSSTSYSKPRALLDTTVICGAMCTNGINMRLLRLAVSDAFQPVLSKVSLFEVYNVALNRGIRGRVYTVSELERFLSKYVNPLLEDHAPVNTAVGRYHVLTRLHEHRPIGQLLAELSGCSQENAEHIIRTAGMEEPLTQYDPDDMHVWLAAIQQQCDYIVTSNTRRFPSRIGSVRRIHPQEFLEEILSLNKKSTSPLGKYPFS